MECALNAPTRDVARCLHFQLAHPETERESMHKARNTLLSIGTAIAGAKLAQTLSNLELDDVLRPLRLARRRSHWGESLAFLGAGIVVGGATALLLAPASGQATRERLAEKAKGLGEAAARTVREAEMDMRDEAAIGQNGDMTKSGMPG